MRIIERIEVLARVEGHNNFAASELRRSLDGISKLESVDDRERLEVLRDVLVELLRVDAPGRIDGYGAGTGADLRVDLPLGQQLRRYLA